MSNVMFSSIFRLQASTYRMSSALASVRAKSQYRRALLDEGNSRAAAVAASRRAASSSSCRPIARSAASRLAAASCTTSTRAASTCAASARAASTPAASTRAASTCRLRPCGLDPCGLDPCSLDPCGLDPCGLDREASTCDSPCSLNLCPLEPCGLDLRPPVRPLLVRPRPFPCGLACGLNLAVVRPPVVPPPVAPPLEVCRLHRGLLAFGLQPRVLGPRRFLTGGVSPCRLELLRLPLPLLLGRSSLASSTARSTPLGRFAPASHRQHLEARASRSPEWRC